MKVLLIGEFSNVHWTLGNALRQQGHEVTVVSDGNNWRQYPCDVRLYRKSNSRLHTIKYIIDILKQLPRWRGYDIVQIINPVLFLELKPERLKKIYDYLRKHNKRIYMGAMGDDHQYIYDSFIRRRLRYCDFYTQQREIDNERNRQAVHEWLYTYKKELCKHVANTCDGIITVLYEYYAAYKEDYPDKSTYIPLPIVINGNPSTSLPDTHPHPIRIFIGMDHRRDELKGTDILYKVAKRLETKYPDRCEIIATESLPYNEYIARMQQCDILLDQIYSYTPAMNALQAMAMGLVTVSGGEEEHYQLILESELRPIINTAPNEEDIYQKLEALILNPEHILQLKHESIEYVRRHHDSLKIAEQYIKFWSREA